VKCIIPNVIPFGGERSNKLKFWQPPLLVFSIGLFFFGIFLFNLDVWIPGSFIYGGIAWILSIFGIIYSLTADLDEKTDVTNQNETAQNAGEKNQ